MTPEDARLDRRDTRGFGVTLAAKNRDGSDREDEEDREDQERRVFCFAFSASRARGDAIAFVFLARVEILIFERGPSFVL